MARILITDGNQRSALAVVRSLGRAGHHCVVAASEFPAFASVSRYCRSTALLDMGDGTTSLQRLRAIADRSRIDLIIPISDDAMTVITAATAAGEIPASKVAAPSPEAYGRLSNKIWLLQQAQELGLSVPRSIVVEGSSGLPDAAKEIGYPCVIKPHQSVVISGSRTKHLFVRFASSDQELKDVAAGLAPEAYPVLVQQRIEGSGEGVFLLTDGNRVLASFAHRRLREYPPAGGASTYRESIPVPAELLSLSARLLASVGWRGVAMVEFKRSIHDGAPYLMEVNGRFWGSLQLAIDAGVDFPQLLVQSMLGEDVGDPPIYRSGVRSRWFWGDVNYLVDRLRHDGAALHLPAAEATLSRLAILANVAKVSPRERIEELQLTDPAPFLFESRRQLGRFVAKVMKRRNAAAGLD